MAGNSVGQRQRREHAAPWVPYTRAGCNFGSVAVANTELENTTPDVPLVFGAHSWEAREAENAKLANKAQADFMGLSVHCAAGSAVCGQAHGGVTDVLPDEPGGYQGYRALFGSRFIQPVISPPARCAASAARSSRTPAVTSASPATTA